MGQQGPRALVDGEALRRARLRLQHRHDPRVQWRHRRRRRCGSGRGWRHWRRWWWCLLPLLVVVVGLGLGLDGQEGRAVARRCLQGGGFGARLLLLLLLLAPLAVAEDAEGREDVGAAVVGQQLEEALEGELQGQRVRRAPHVHVRLQGPRNIHRHARRLEQLWGDAQPLPRHGGGRAQRLGLGEPAQDLGLLWSVSVCGGESCVKSVY